MPVYRNQTNTMTQITMLNRLRITTSQEAVAFLRAIQPLQEQVAAVLQKESLRKQQDLNRRAVPAPTTPEPEPISTPEPEKKFEPEDLSSDEGYSESEIEAKVEKLKKSKTQAKKEKIVKEEK